MYHSLIFCALDQVPDSSTTDTHYTTGPFNAWDTIPYDGQYYYWNQDDTSVSYPITISQYPLEIKDTWADWKLIPTSRPAFAPPPLKTKTIDIPGGNGSLDVSQALTRYPIYENRTGIIDFMVVNDFYEIVTNTDEWYERYSEIANYLHGNRFRVTLDDDRKWFYVGKFAVDAWKSDKNYSTITISYTLEPYKWNHLYVGIDEWEWDTFNFTEDTINTDYMSDYGYLNDKYFINLTYQKGFENYEILHSTPEDHGIVPTKALFRFGTDSGDPITITITNKTTGYSYTGSYTHESTNDDPYLEIEIPGFIFYGDVIIKAQITPDEESTTEETSGYVEIVNVRKGSL